MADKIGDGKYEIKQRGPNIFSIKRPDPTEYIGFDYLKGKKLIGVWGDTIRIEDEKGNQENLLIKESSNALFLTDYKLIPGDREIGISDSKQFLNGFEGHKINEIEKTFFSEEDRRKDLPVYVKLISESSLYSIMLTSADGDILVHGDISTKGLIEYTRHKLKEGKEFTPQEAKGIEASLGAPVFDKEQLKEENSELFSAIYS